MKLKEFGPPGGGGARVPLRSATGYWSSCSSHASEDASGYRHCAPFCESQTTFKPLSVLLVDVPSNQRLLITDAIAMTS